MRKMDGKPSERQIAKQRFREIFGDQMLKDVEAWQAEVVRVGKAREARDARMRKTAKDREAASQNFMEAQRRVGRGLDFANQLPPATDSHYAGKGVKLGTPDKPIFWYRPKDAKKYRVIYADLTVREADAAPNVPNGAAGAGGGQPEEIVALGGTALCLSHPTLIRSALLMASKLTNRDLPLSIG